MALAFGATKGKAVKSSRDAYKYKDGENVVRLVGGILPRYVYWLKGTNNKDIPVECLAFSREDEKFNNADVDHVPEFFPDKKCGWAYSIKCIDPSDGKVKVLDLKKKLFEQIMDTSSDLGDPTDADSGWDVVFKRAKTGPLAFNVEYTLNPLRCKKRPLTEDERAAVAAATTIDVDYPRPTPADVLKTLERMAKGDDEDTPEDGTDKEAVNDL